jgi:pyruvyltransferase
MIRLYAWTDWPNFGDALSRDVVAWASNQPVQLVPASTSNKLLAVGSVLQHAKSGDVIWGTGVNPYDYQDFWINYSKSTLDLNVLAVRGPITRDVLISRKIHCPPVFGDPAVLLPMIYPKDLSRVHEAILIPHLKDHSYYKSSKAASLGIPVVDPANEWRNVVDLITSAQLVISSSLHGIIVAEAYGVPAIWFRPTQGEGYLKFQDYYGSTHRAPFPIYELRDCLQTQPLPPPNLSNMRSGLLGAFDHQRIQSICGTDTVAFNNE